MDVNWCMVVAIEKEKVTVFLKNPRPLGTLRTGRRLRKNANASVKVHNHCANPLGESVCPRGLSVFLFLRNRLEDWLQFLRRRKRNTFTSRVPLKGTP